MKNRAALATHSLFTEQNFRMELLSKNKLKYIRSLKTSKFRQKYNNFIVEGFKSIHEFLKAGTFEIECLVMTKEVIDGFDFNSYKNLHKSLIYLATEADLALISNLSTPSKAIAILKRKDYNIKKVLTESNIVFYLDDVQDPGNVGTIIRVVDWFGFGVVIRSENSADFFSPKVVQASMGSINNVKLATCDDIEQLKFGGHKILVLDMEGEDVNHFNFPEKSILVLGNEGNGISEQLLSISSNKLSIFGSDNRVAESLNVAITAGIIAHKVFKSN